MGKRFKASVVLPDSYNSSKKRYSVVYLLHGYSQNFSAWPKVAPLRNYSDTYQLIFVCPDGNRNSWYIDSPVLPGSKFETYIAREVVAYIDSSFRTIATARGRGLCGSSMGGHGALRILWNNPAVFIAATSISGILALAPFAGQWDLSRVLGRRENNMQNWQRYSVAWLADSVEIKQRGIFIDCGMSDPALSVNRAVHEKLSKKGIAHDYRESPGGHTPQYVRAAVEYHICFLSRMLRKPGN
jgi:S-formylglutathione hydrolase FrmB